MELRRYYATLRRRWLVIALTAIAGVLAGYFSTPRDVSYTTGTTLYVGSSSFQTGNSNAAVSGDTQVGLQQVIQTFAKMIPSEPIATEALNRTGVKRSAGEVLAATQVTPDLSLIYIRVSDRDPAVAQRLANGMAEAFVERIEAFEPGQTPEPGALPKLPAYIFERASLPTVPEPNGMARHVLLGLFFGLAVGIAAVFLLEYLDITIKSPAEAERRLELPVMGVIPYERTPLAVSARGQRPVVV